MKTSITGKPIPTVEGSLQTFSADPVACMQKLQQEHGDLVALREGDQDVVFAFGADYNRRVLSRPDDFHSRFFAIRGPKRSAQRRLSSGLLSMNGDEHSQQRRILQAAFQKRAIPGYASMIEHHTQEMLDRWKPGRAFDLNEEMIQLLLRISSSMLFGMSDPKLALEIGGMMDEWVRLNHELGAAAFESPDEFYPQYQHLLQYSEQLEERIREMISQVENGPLDGDDVLSLLIRAKRMGAPLTDEQLIGQAAIVFGAAHLTTSHTLTWTLLLLAQHPEVMRQLDAEFGSTPKAIVQARPDSTPNGLARKESSLLDRVIHESMRILPASAYSQRVSQRDLRLGRFFLPANSIVVFSQFMTHRNEWIFPESKRFSPDRWLDLSPSAYEYLPFGGGPRLCIGAALATSILRTVLPMTLRKFRIGVQPHAKVDALVVSTMLTPVSGLPVTVWTGGDVAETAPIRGNLNSLVDLPELQQIELARAA
ncbi:MAG: cytochrome P450 [Planctomycetota bacterium]|nr:cytochrome P450 [Planctomycetota bacterium]MDA1249799.1 cytochrome P450 [Planctomycetota bacterium]